MTTAPAANLQTLIDGQRFGGFGLRVLVVSFLVMMADGYDLQLASFAASGVAAEWGVPRPSLAPMLTASLFGILVGAPLFGWFGDRFGRKPAVILCCALIAAMSLGCALAPSLTWLIIMRALTGVGIGGLAPNMIALNAELARTPLRGRFVVLMFVGLTIGAASPGILMGLFPALHDWRALFAVGAAAPLLGALAVAALLPESPAILLARGQSARLRTLLRQMRPDLSDIPANIQAEGTRKQDAALSALFAGRLKVTTPVFWGIVTMVYLCIYLLTSWTPLLLQGAGLSQTQAAGATSALHLGGALGGLITSVIIDRYGWAVIAVFLAIGVGAAAAAGAAPVPPHVLPYFVGLCGFGIIGAQFGINAATGLLYDAQVRSRGAGLASGVGRIGSIAGPFLGGALVAAGVSGRGLFLVTVAPISLAVLMTGFLIWRDGLSRPFRGR